MSRNRLIVPFLLLTSFILFSLRDIGRAESSGNLLGATPLAFTRNEGQWDNRVLFRADAGGATMWFTGRGAYYQFTRRIPERGSAAEDYPSHLLDHFDEASGRVERLVIELSFVGANPDPRVIGEELLKHKCHYFFGADPGRWRTNVPNFKSVVYQEIYPGIDVKYYGNGRQMEYDLVVSAGADPDRIRIRYDGTKPLRVNEAGELVVETEWGAVTERKPLAYQLKSNTRTHIQAEYVLLSDNTFGFSLGGGYDSDLPVFIDPVLSYSSYLGGGCDDESFDIDVDGTGNVYVTGRTSSADFPTVDPIQATNAGDFDVFVTKLDPMGEGLLYSTYLGGNDNDRARGIAVDFQGNAYVTGQTSSADFPTVNAYQENFAGAGSEPPYYSGDAFVAKLSSTGDTLVYSTYLGGSGDDGSRAVAVSAEGSAYITGFTTSTNFPVSNPIQPLNAGGWDAFVARLNTQGDELVYSTYLGGSNKERGGTAIAVDGNGDAYVTGYTRSTDFPMFNPFQAANAGDYDVFVSKLSATGSILIYSTYLGGDDYDRGGDIAVDSGGYAHVTGYSYSPDFPTVNPFQGTRVGSADVFVTKLSPMGNDLIYSTYLGGSGKDWGYGIDIDSDGYVYAVGVTASTDFPVVDALQQSYAGGDPTLQYGGDAFLSKLSVAADSLVYSTYLGGSDGDWAFGVVLHGNGVACLTGWTASTDFPTANPFQESCDGCGEGWIDAFVAMILDECIDTDGDGYGDPGHPENDCPDDNCPYVYNPDQADTDADGIGDVCDECTDTDDDGFGNPGFPVNTCPDDNCPDIYNPDQADIDNDEIGDVCDNCPGVSNPGQEDGDGDTVGDACDNCPLDENTDQADSDGDDVGDVCDNCPAASNSGQEDADGDGIGDVCDECTDTDGDGYGNPEYAANTCPDDNCPTIANPGQEDGDSDGVGDVCDNCPHTANSAQEDQDEDGLGDVCDICPLDPFNDIDGDGICGDIDNCPGIYNPLQEDSDSDGIGDACEDCCIPPMRGNIDYDGADEINIADLLFFVEYSFGSPPGPPPPCFEEADVDGSGEIDIGDVLYMVEYMFGVPTGPAPVNCP